VRAQLPPPAASTVYRLTAAGDELGHALVPLIAWGLRHAVPEEPGPDTAVCPHWSLLAFTHQTVPAQLDGIDATYRFVIEGRTAYLRIRDGRATVLQGLDGGEPDATVTLGAATVAAIGSGRTTAIDAVVAGRVEIVGGQEAVDDLVRAFA
uniref:SCP2 sterol-binding domain-containing protein n=1 Tax=Nocardioides stalactiti TaxID=2755356 RepID=UPI0016008C8B